MLASRPGPLALGLSFTLTLAGACRAELGQPITRPDAAAVPNPAPTLHPELQRTVQSLLPALDSIPAERREALDALARYVLESQAAGRSAKLIFICTHNSRRSHMGQLWAATAAAWFEVGGVETFSGGTEATAFNPRAVAAMERAGFGVDNPGGDHPGGDNPGGDNPRYQVTLSPEAPAMTAFSKTWADPANPSEGFAAVMTCTQADEACPFVRGASLRIALPYEDPKLADGTAQELQTYDERSRQIAAEMLYLFRAAAQGS